MKERASPLPDPVRARTTGAIRLMPDPFSPVSKSDAHRHGAGYSGQRQRRARILAATRMLIARGGFQCVTIRNIADLSGLSVQTIYNLVGNRTQVLEAAVDEYIATTTKEARNLPAYPNIFIALADLVWMKVVENPEYSRHATISYNSLDQTFDHVHRRQARALKRLLQRHYGEIASTKGSDLNILANHITLLIGATALEWARGKITLPQLRYRFSSVYATLLAGLSSEQEQAGMMAWLAQIRA